MGVNRVARDSCGSEGEEGGILLVTVERNLSEWMQGRYLQSEKEKGMEDGANE
jgi:hypothetical protein